MMHGHGLMALSICDSHERTASTATLPVEMHAPVNLTEHSNKGGETPLKLTEARSVVLTGRAFLSIYYKKIKKKLRSASQVAIVRMWP